MRNHGIFFFRLASMSLICLDLLHLVTDCVVKGKLYLTNDLNDRMRTVENVGSVAIFTSTDIGQEPGVFTWNLHMKHLGRSVDKKKLWLSEIKKTSTFSRTVKC